MACIMIWDWLAVFTTARFVHTPKHCIACFAPVG
jgi:hypothetical protein